MNVTYEHETGFEIEKQKNEMYEWGFDLTDFNERYEPTGAIKFKELLDKFTVYYKRQSKGFVWSNKDESIVIVTANNPITGEYSNSEFREPEKGYLGYVGVSCKSSQVLQEFIKEFRIKAAFIKEESNGRIYI